MPCDYDGIKGALENRKRLFAPAAGTRQEGLDRPVYISDAAHSLGARYKGRPVGSCADFTVFSFHAVKNVTTAEGGAVVFSDSENRDPAGIEKTLRLLSLHGQDKDALSKTQLDSWRYCIEIPGYKCNMTDIQASLGIVQLGRYEKEMIHMEKKYHRHLQFRTWKEPRLEMPVFSATLKSNRHIIFLWPGSSPAGKAKGMPLSEDLAERNIAANVHYIPVVMHPAYTGSDIPWGITPIPITLMKTG